MINWIGVGIWILLGVALGLFTKLLVRLPDETSGHGSVLAILGAFGAVIGGMLGVGIFHFDDPVAVSVGGMAGAAFLALVLSGVYRWGVKRMI